MKKIFMSFFLVCALLACKQETKVYSSEIHFETMGTYGMVKIVSDSLIQESQISKVIDDLLIDVNMALSTYIDSSIVSLINTYGSYPSWEYNNIDDHYDIVYFKSMEIKSFTNASFDYQIKPIVDFWGFGNLEMRDISSIDSLQIDSILHCMHISDDWGCMQLDFSAIAKGYGVDVLTEYLESLGHKNFMVEIGGEVVCKGLNADKIPWRLGIEEPNEEIRVIYQVVGLENKAMATSGNYRNFKVLESGQKIVHIINPKTGYPEISNLLSASIMANNCMEADAYATACMVMGLDTCYQFLLDQPELDGYLIFSNENGDLQSKYTDGFINSLIN